MSKQLYGAIASSQDPSEVANKVKGVILALSSVIILIASHVFGFTLTADNVVSLAADAGTVAGAIWAIYGVILHGVTVFGTKPAENV